MQWGLPQVYSNDFYTNYTNAALEADWYTAPYQDSDASWVEQRMFINFAIEALVVGGHPLAQIILVRCMCDCGAIDSLQDRLAALVPAVPNLSGFTPVHPATTPVQLNGVTIAFDSTGAIVELRDTVANINWASAINAVGKFVYQASPSPAAARLTRVRRSATPSTSRSAMTT